MKTRETELHEPQVEIKKMYRSRTTSVRLRCSVCNAILRASWHSKYDGNAEEHADVLKKSLKHNGIFYCQHCGARLVEIGNTGDKNIEIIKAIQRTGTVPKDMLNNAIAEHQ